MADERGDEGRFSRAVAVTGRVYRGIKEGPSTNPFREFFLFVGGIFKWLIFLALLVLLVLAFTAALNANTKGLTQTYVTRLEVAINNNQLVAPIYQGLKDTLAFRKDPTLIERRYGWKTVVDDNKENLQLGLIFKKFKPDLIRYDTEETNRNDINLGGLVEVDSLKDTSTIKFSCSSKDIPEDKIITSPKEIKILKGERRVQDVTCTIPPNTLTLPTGKEIYTYQVKLNAVYDFKTNANMGVYTIQRSQLQSLREKGGHPLQDKEDPYLDKNTFQTISRSTYGPMALSIELPASQPLVETSSTEDFYRLRIGIKKSSSSWIGRINKINQVYLYLPINFQLLSEDFEEIQDSNVDVIELIEDSGYKKYKLKENKIKELNDQCKKFGGKDTQECKDFLERGFLISSVRFTINNAESTVVNDYIGAEVDYDFEAEIFTSFTLIRPLDI